MKTNSRYPAPPQPLLGCAREAPRACALPLGIVSSAFTCQEDVGPSLWELLPLHCKELQTLGCSSWKRDFICLVAQSHPHTAIFYLSGMDAYFLNPTKLWTRPTMLQRPLVQIGLAHERPQQTLQGLEWFDSFGTKPRSNPISSATD